MTNKIKSYFGLLALALVALLPLSAKAQSFHMDSQQVNAQVQWLAVHGYDLSQPLYEAFWLTGQGVTLYDNGSWQLDGQGVVSASAEVQEAYESVFYATGDSTLASENAAGLLTPQEEAEARSGGAGGQYYALNGFWSVRVGYYTNGGGGGGGLLN